MSQTFLKNSAGKIQNFLASRKFFWAIVIFFVLQALWLVFSAHYPLAFDERFHFQSIKVYAENWPSPFLTDRPEWTDALGAISRDTSYLFHCVMSYPYKFIALFTDNQAAQVIILRLLNVAMFTGGLLLFARVLRRAGVSNALRNTALAIFVLVPIVPYLAAHINYDNLFFLLLPWLLLLAFRLVEKFKKQQVDIKTLLMFIIGCAALGLVKMASLPLLVAVVVFLVFIALHSFWQRPHLFPESVRANFQAMTPVIKISLLVGLVVVSGLFFQRYGLNTVNYGTINPSCDQIISLEQCLDHGPFARNYNVRQNSSGDFNPDPVLYMGEWLWGMWHRSFFAVAGIEDRFDNSAGLPVPKFTAIALAAFGLLAVFVKFRAVFRGRAFLQMLAIMSVFYLAVLWLQLYTGIYSDTGYVAAVNGRYLIPVLLPLAAVMGIAISNVLRKKPTVKPYLAAAAILLFFYGGGVFTYIIISDQGWLWQNGVVLEINDAARNILSLLIVH